VKFNETGGSLGFSVFFKYTLFLFLSLAIQTRALTNTFDLFLENPPVERPLRLSWIYQKVIFCSPERMPSFRAPPIDDPFQVERSCSSEGTLPSTSRCFKQPPFQPESSPSSVFAPQ